MGEVPESIGEVVTSIPAELALRQAEIHATRALTTSVDRLAERMDVFGTDLGEIKSKVTVIEARNFDNQIKKLEEDTRRDVDGLRQSNTARDNRVNVLEQQMAKFGAYVAVAGAIGGVAMGIIATKVFGG